jgi:hypothetical protein
MSTPENATTTAEHDGTKRAFSSFSGNIALAISAFALALGAYQTRLMQSQARAGVWPYLSIGYSYTSNVDKDAFVWTVNNNGVGPARVESVTLKLDDKPMKRWDDVLAVFGVTNSPSMGFSSINGEVIPPNTNRETTVQPIRVNVRDVATLFKAAEHRFQMDICYCSVYDECWIAHWQRSKVDPVARCEATDAPFEE